MTEIKNCLAISCKYCKGYKCTKATVKIGEYGECEDMKRNKNGST